MGPHASGCLDTLSSWMVSEKAGQGEECSNFDELANNSCPHSEHTYTPERATGINEWANKAWTFIFMPHASLLLTGLEVILIFFSTRERAIWHFIHFKCLQTKRSFSLVWKVCLQGAARLKLEQTCTSRSCVNSLVSRVWNRVLCSLLPLDGSTNVTVH